MASIRRSEEMLLGTQKSAGVFDGLWKAVKPVADLFGVGLVYYLELCVTEFGVFAAALAILPNAVNGLLDSIPGLNKYHVSDDDPALLRRARFLAPGIKMDQEKNTKETEADRKKRIPQSNTTIHKVEIHVQSNQDPFRVARATLKVLNDVARNPKVSRDAPGSDIGR